MLVGMPKASFQDVLEALRSNLRDLERVRMTSPDDPELLDLKREIQDSIKRGKAAGREH